MIRGILRALWWLVQPCPTVPADRHPALTFVNDFSVEAPVSTEEELLECEHPSAHHEPSLGPDFAVCDRRCEILTLEEASSPTSIQREK